MKIVFWQRTCNHLGKLLLTLPASLTPPGAKYIDSQIRRLNGLFHREIATFGDIRLPADLNPAATAVCEEQKAELRQPTKARRSADRGA